MEAVTEVVVVEMVDAEAVVGHGAVDGEQLGEDADDAGALALRPDRHFGLDACGDFLLHEEVAASASFCRQALEHTRRRASSRRPASGRTPRASPPQPSPPASVVAEASDADGGVGGAGVEGVEGGA